MEVVLSMCSNHVSKLIVWLVCSLLNILIRMLLVDTLAEASVNLLTIIPILWVIVEGGRLILTNFKTKERE